MNFDNPEIKQQFTAIRYCGTNGFSIQDISKFEARISVIVPDGLVLYS